MTMMMSGDARGGHVEMTYQPNNYERLRDQKHLLAVGAKVVDVFSKYEVDTVVINTNDGTVSIGLHGANSTWAELGNQLNEICDKYYPDED